MEQARRLEGHWAKRSQEKEKASGLSCNRDRRDSLPIDAVPHVAGRKEAWLEHRKSVKPMLACADHPRNENTFCSFQQGIVRSSDW